MSEFIEAMKARLIDGLIEIGVTRETAGQVVAEAVLDVVRDHAGERILIARTGAERIERARRDRQIIRDWKAGERIPLLARRYNLSRVRIWQIISGT